MRVYIGGVQPRDVTELDRKFGKRAELRFLSTDLDVAGWKSAFKGNYDLVFVGERIAGHKRTADVPKQKLVVLSGSLSSFVRALDDKLPPEPKPEPVQIVQAAPEPEPEPTPEPVAAAPAPPAPELRRKSVMQEVTEHLRKVYDNAAGMPVDVQLPNLLRIVPDASIHAVQQAIRRLCSIAALTVQELGVGTSRFATYRVQAAIHQDIEFRTVRVSGDARHGAAPVTVVRNGNGAAVNGNGADHDDEHLPEPKTREERAKRLVSNMLDLLSTSEESNKAAMNALWDSQQQQKEKLLVLMAEMEAVVAEGADLSQVPTYKLRDALHLREIEERAALSRTGALATVAGWMRRQ